MDFVLLSLLVFCFFATSLVPQANRCQLSGLEVEGSSICVGQTYLCVLSIWGRSGSGHVNRISSFHAQSPPMIIDPGGYVECVFRVQGPAADSRISGQSHELARVHNLNLFFLLPHEARAAFPMNCSPDTLWRWIKVDL